jgi:hypothetical protein
MTDNQINEDEAEDAKLAAKEEAELLPALAAINAAIPAEWQGPRPTRLTELKGVIPFQGFGECDSGEKWYFRLRGDRVSLCVYAESLIEPRLDISCRGLTGDPFAASLGEAEATRLIGAMWPRLGEGEVGPEGLAELLDFREPFDEVAYAALRAETTAMIAELEAAGEFPKAE